MHCQFCAKPSIFSGFFFIPLCTDSFSKSVSIRASHSGSELVVKNSVSVVFVFFLLRFRVFAFPIRAIHSKN
jgi:hypothetical protein